MGLAPLRGTCERPPDRGRGSMPRIFDQPHDPLKFTWIAAREGNAAAVRDPDLEPIDGDRRHARGGQKTDDAAHRQHAENGEISLRPTEAGHSDEQHHRDSHERETGNQQALIVARPRGPDPVSSDVVEPARGLTDMQDVAFARRPPRTTPANRTLEPPGRCAVFEMRGRHHPIITLVKGREHARPIVALSGDHAAQVANKALPTGREGDARGLRMPARRAQAVDPTHGQAQPLSPPSATGIAILKASAFAVSLETPASRTSRSRNRLVMG